LLVGSMIRASTNAVNTSSRPAATSRPNAVERAGQGIGQEQHPGRGDRQRRTRTGRRAGLVQTEVELTLTCLQTLPGNSFQQLQLGVIMRRTDVLDVP
jgi:hypothetical protein